MVSARCWVAGHGSRPLLVGGSAWTALSVTGAYVHHVPVIGNYSAHAGGATANFGAICRVGQCAAACPALWLAGGLQLSIVGVASFAVIGKLVGAGRFELPTPGPPDRCANRAALRSDLRNQIFNLGAVGNRASPQRYFTVIASPLRSAFAISPTCRPESSRTAPFWLVSTMARTPAPTAMPAPAAA